ncbi:MAG: two-component regulator propeller domain-containing protein, partial [Bacteroidota bacterium]
APHLELEGGEILLSGFQSPVVLRVSPEGGDRFRATRLPIDGLEMVETGRGATVSVHRIAGRLMARFSQEDGLVPLRFDPDASRLVRAGPTRVPFPRVRDLMVQDREAVGVRMDGLWRMRGAPDGPAVQLLEGHVTAAAVDREGGLWVGTFGRGVARVRSTGLVQLTPNSARRVALRGDRAWASSREGFSHLIRLDGPSPEAIPTIETRFASFLPDGRVRPGAQAILLEPIEADRALPPDPTLIHLLPRAAHDPDWISSAVETADTLWLGTYAHGVRRFRKTASGLVELDTVGVRDGLPTETVEDLARTSAGTWAIARRGLALLTGETARAMGTAEGLPSSAIYSVYEARDGTHWAGTDRGVARLDLAGWRAEAVGRDAMAGRPVVAMFEREATPGVLWAVTTHALWRIEAGTAQMIEGVPLVHDRRQTVEHAAYHAASDRLVLATNGGTSLLSLDDVSAGPSLAPPIALVAVHVDDAPVALMGTPRDARLGDLVPGRHRVVIEAAVLRFGAASAVEWREDGGDWHPADDGRITLASVSAGDHEIEVRAVTPGGVVSENTARLSFRVAPRWWERRAVQGVLGLLGLGMLIGGVRYASQRRLRARVQELEVEQRLQAERERISRDLHDHVGAEVAAILIEAEVGRLEAAANGRDTGALREVEQRARRTMGSLREAIWALGHGALTPAALAERLGAFAATQARHSSVTVEAQATGQTDRPLPATQALALYRIGQEAIRNAIRHSGGTRLGVTVEAHREGVAVIVRDDGTFGGPAGDGGGYGLGNMQARAEALGGTLALTNGEGTTVRAEIPVV